MTLLRSYHHHHRDAADVFLITDRINVASRLCVEGEASRIGINLSCIEANPIPEALRQSVRNYYSLSSFLKLCIGDLLPETYQHAIYIDPDAIVTAPINWMPATEPIKIIGAVPDPLLNRPAGGLVRERLGLSKDTTIYNSGFMVIDLAGWKREGIGKRALAYAVENPNRLTFVDQCALNAAAHDRFYTVDTANNYMPNFYYDGGCHPSILHFAGEGKPWLDCTVPGAAAYWKFRRLTELPMDAPRSTICLLRYASLLRKLLSVLLRTTLLRRSPSEKEKLLLVRARNLIKLR